LTRSGAYAIYREQPSASVTVANKTMTYGDTLPTLTGTPSGLLNGDAPTYAISGRVDSTSGNIKASGTPYTLTETALADLGYNLTTTTGSLTVNTKTLTLTGFDVANKTYDGNTTATINNAGTLTGVVTNDVVSVSNTGATFADKHFGIGKTVTLDGVALGDTDAGNYAIGSTTDTADISKLAITVTANAQSKIYGNADPALTYAGSSLVGTDAYTGALSRASGEDVAIYAINQGTLGINDGNSGNNYAVTYTGANLTIDQRAITLAADAVSKTYGNADPALSASISAGSLGSVTVSDSLTDVTGTLSRQSGEDVGSYDVTLGTGSKASNYAITFATDNNALTIGQRAITLSADAVSKTYGNADPALSASISAGSLGSVTVSDSLTDVTGTLSRQSGEDVGSYDVNLGTGTKAGNYAITFATDNNALTIDQRAITLAADAVSKTYGNADPALSASISAGSLGSVTVSDSLADVTGTLSRQSGENVGSYDVTLGTGTKAGNYAITFVADNNALTIGQRAITLVADAVSKTYGDADPTLSASISAGSLGSVAVSDTLADVTGTLGREAGENVGSYDVNLGTGTKAGNYAITFTTDNDALTINKKTVSLSASKIYDGSTDLSGDVAIVTGVGAETLTYSGATASNKHVVTADKYIEAITLGDGGNGGLASNYQLPALDAANAPVTIIAATLSPSLSNVGYSQVYDGEATADITPTWSFAGLAPNDTAATLGFISAVYNDKDVLDANSITVSGLSITSISGGNGSFASDYVLDGTSKSVAASITKASLTVRANDDAKFVTQADPAFTASYTGFVHGETTAELGGALLIERDNALTDTAANTYSGVLLASGLSADNYALNYVAGDFTIVPSDQLLVRVTNVSNAYGTATQYTIGSVEYYNGSDVVRLDDSSVVGSSVSIDAGNGVSIDDGSAGTASFTLAPQSAAYSTANKLKVGGYQLGISGAVTENSANFSDTITVVGAHQVNSQALTVSASNVSKVYDGTTSMMGITLELATLESNGGTSDRVTVNGQGAFDSKDVATHIGYTVSGLSLSGDDAANYHLSGGTSFTDSNGEITKRTVTLSAGKTYDGTTDLAGDVTISTGVGTETLTYSGATASNAHVATADKYIEAITLADGGNGGVASNYQLPTLDAANAPVTITTATLIPSLSNAGYSQTYDGDTTADLTPTWTFSGLVSGDTDAALSYAAAAYNDKDVLDANQITVSGLNLTGITGGNGSQVSDYVLDGTSKTVAATITAKTVTLTAGKTYDGSTDLSGDVTISTGVGTETLSYTGATASNAHVATADKYIDAITLADGGNGGVASNYQLPTLDAANAPVTITTATLIPSLSNAGYSQTYDGDTTADLTPTWTFSGLVSGDTDAALSYAAAAYNDKDVLDANQITVSGLNLTGITGGNGSQVSDYVLDGTSKTVAATITAKTVTLTAGKTYDGSTDLSGDVTISTGVGTETLSYTGATASNAHVATADKYIDAITLADGGNGGVASNYQLPTLDAANAPVTITTATLTPTLSNVGYSQTYDGDTTADLTPTWTFNGLVSGDTDAALSYAATAYNDKDVLDANTITVSGLNLTGITGGNGSQVSDYVLDGTSKTVAATITAKAVTLTPQAASRAYDGSTAYTFTTFDLAVLSQQLGVAGEVVTAGSATFNDKNAANDKTLTATAVTISDGVNDGGSNYTITYGSDANSSITRLGSVTWIGGATGNWFDPANWAGGAVPDLSNVAHVVIPTNVTVSFDTAGVVAPADTSSAVNIDSLGTSGSLTQTDGTLNIGTGGMTLANYTQNGGVLTNAGATNLSSFTQSAGSFSGTGHFSTEHFTQTGGTTTLHGNLTVTQGFSQGSSGSVSVGGNTSITDTSGGTVIGNLSTTGTTSITSRDGDITQAAGTTVVSGGTTTLVASDGGAPATLYDIVLDGTNNDFQSAVSATGNDITLVDANALTAVLDASGDSTLTAGGDLTVSGSTQNLTTTTTNGGATTFGATTVAGDLNATSDGDVSQTGPLGVTGTTTINASGNDVILDHAGNDFGGTVNVTGNDITLVDANALTAVLNASGDSTLTTGGDLTVSGSTQNLTTTTTNGGATTFGATTVAGDLNATSDGDVSQTGPLGVTGTTTINASGNDVILDHAGNDFGGTVNVTGNDITLVDANALTAVLNASGDSTLTAGGDLTVSGSTRNLTTTTTNGGTTTFGATTVAGDLNTSSDGDVSQTGPLGVTGTTTINAVGNDVTLDHAGNDFGGTVNVTGNDVSLNDSNSLMLGDVTVTGDLTLQSNGALDLGTSTVDGALNADSGNGGITQTGPVQTGGHATFVAGTGTVQLPNTDNRFPEGTTVIASDSTIVGDAVADAEEAQKKLAGLTPEIPMPATDLSVAPMPQVLTMVDGAGTGGGSGDGAAGAGAGANGNGITIKLDEARASGAPLMVTVSLPKGTSTIGTGFSFDLPESIRAMALAAGGAQAALPNGASLPAWLSFDATTLTFNASAVPDGAFPLQVEMTISGQRVTVVISERTE
jgi:ABC-type Fe3+ transport system substrate-binding protein